MATVRRGSVIAVGVTALVLAFAACGGAAATGNAPTPPSRSSPAPPPATVATPGAVDPNAPEVVEAGDIPDNQVFVPYAPPGAAFQVSVPEGWARSTEGSAVVFTDKFNSVRIEMVRRPAAPDVASASAEEVPALASSVPGYQPGEVTAVQRKGGPAVLVTYAASSPADPVTGKSVRTAVERYEFWSGGQELIVSLSGPQGADNVDPWRIVSDSVVWR